MEMTEEGRRLLDLEAQGNAMAAETQRHADDLAEILKPETVKAIAALGLDALAVGSHWTRWPKKMQALEAAGKLIEAIRAEAEQWRRAREHEEANRWQGGIESRQLFGIDLEAPPPAP